MTTEILPERRSPVNAFWRFWLAANVSNIGSTMTVVALPLVALTVLHASVLQVTLLATAGSLPWLVLGLPAGVLVQRFPLRNLQVLLDLVRTVAIGSIPVAWWLEQLTYGQLLAAAAVAGSATVLFDIGNSTFLPAVVDKKELSARNSWISGAEAVTQTGGPSVSGVLVQLMGPVGVLMIDAASYLVSAALLRTLPERRPEVGSQTKFLQLLKEGWSFVVRHPVMLPCMLWATTVNFVNAALFALTPLYLVKEANVSATVVGIVIAMDGLGALIGSGLATRLARRLGTARVIIVMGFFSGTLALMIPLTTMLGNIYFYALGFSGFSFGVVIGSIMTRTHRQTESPPELLSRVMATVRFVSWGATPVGAAVGGLLAVWLGLRPALWLVCGGALLAPLVLLFSPVRLRRNLAEPQEG
ncbi:MFS transporter [Streptomyces sp. NBC_00347]|uniref:MFS transporter n=1 Tax=Streptomyces sp. NBC_00347 TaxID=2975721 RepID=UPI002254CFAB|nr:MFS transporter [Streptomyces sp. NBC_00347]MCX5126768.1 MFS transporter [Streptomyces sp. NBC_00347]